MKNPGTLYVFLHGLTVVAQRGSQLEVVLPRIPGHVYRAGNWLSEAEIGYRSVIRLRGVKRGTESFVQKSFVIHLPDCSLTFRRRAATLWLPMPRDILGLRRVRTTSGGFIVTRIDTGGGQDEVAIVQVLIYDYDDENEVVLEGHPVWEPASLAGAISLHIISTSEALEGEEHERVTGDILGRVIRGYHGFAFAKPTSPPDWRDTKNGDYGLMTDAAGTVSPTGLKPSGEHIVTGDGKYAFAVAELEDFRPRITRIGRLGRLKQEKRPIEGLWDEPDPLGEETSNCVTYSIP
ncbi:MAG TPA: hypothetical protein VFV34_16625 [Blastocatellia bacterium]|nr:hypothetical protein [Blastocatellia bacterium]